MKDLRTLFESSPGLFLVLAPQNYDVAAVSDAYLQATMTKREEILGRTLFDVFPDNPRVPQATGARNLRASLERVKSSSRADAMAVQRYPIRQPPDQGGGFEDRWWNPINAPVLGKGGELAYIIHRVEDVTSYVEKANEALRESEERLRLAIEAAQIGTWEVELGSGDIRESQNVAPMFGKPEGTPFRNFQSFAEMIHPEDDIE